MSRIIFEDETLRKRRSRSWLLVGAAVLLFAGYWLGGADNAQRDDFPRKEEVGKTPTVQNKGSDIAAAVPQSVAPQSSLPECTVTDGDTLKCGTRDIRLLGLDAPELPGHCRSGRDCVEGDPFAASLALQTLIEVESLEVIVSGKDSYGRDLANIYANGENVGCKLIEAGHAIYVAKWDDGEKLRRDCKLET